MKNHKLAILLVLALFVVLGLANAVPGFAQEPQTVAESSQYKSTSLYKDVMAFINALQQQSPLIRVESLCRSAEGRDVPLMILADPPVSSPQDLKRDGRAVVYIQANIHAGEVEGKEASLMLARDILLHKKPAVLDKLVVLIAPIFNADGNEKISTTSRPQQDGPENGVSLVVARRQQLKSLANHRGTVCINRKILCAIHLHVAIAERCPRHESTTLDALCHAIADPFAEVVRIKLIDAA